MTSSADQNQPTVHSNCSFYLLTDVLREGGFSVHKFLTNDSELQALIDECEPGVSKQPSESYYSSNLGQSNTKSKVLGLPWDQEMDTISVDFADALSISCDAMRLPNEAF